MRHRLPPWRRPENRSFHSRARVTLEEMELSSTGADANGGGVRPRLKSSRQILLSLHKALLDSERTSYELVHGEIPTPAAFLQLLIHDPWFAWLQPVTTLLVQIDEALAAKNPPRDDRELERLLADTRALLSPSTDLEEGFWKRYAAVLQRDPAVVILHREIANSLS